MEELMEKMIKQHCEFQDDVTLLKCDKPAIYYHTYEDLTIYSCWEHACEECKLIKKDKTYGKK